ncbi:MULTISPECIES: CPBP family intramembrane glutamic endopeptidase [Bacillus cereus group]|uniref:CPBP family intramembrane glutamic endopeptidase n=1 Tax=Bacillus cereus group TaxID=86661 RepID=UPI0013936384|nr:MULTISPECIES: type II CAAX endopeptidase family protein [Bacillus cereus group]MDM5375032.1 type II CAAX endopeptidase family protein [Bacillus bombysepticus]MCR6788131.1 CPBP family intramembrane metalloprotease [Bacillus thuringiensis]MCR6822183.1 CPBP family intramembrane metalloprotease [Bacillus thuringiensis]MCR6830207.1 CPBP family intramembrane metalloprotease [Bacillus thuringiensis]MEB8929312.1 type II CAAX endopeptidase family protein [Bacillus cereus]
MNFIKMNKKEIIMLIIFTLFVPFQIGLYILFGISLLANVNLVESEFVLSAIGFTVPAIVGIIYFRKEIIESFTYFKEKTILKIVSIPMVVLFTLIVEQCVMHFLATGQPENQEQLLETGAEVPLVFTLLVFGILGPILEEIVFRHILINRFSYHIGTAMASIISIMIFTLLHTNQLSDIAIYLPGSLILTAAYLISKRSIAYVIAIHMLNNCLAFIL